MRIAFDAGAIVGEKNRGIGNYALQLFTTLIAAHPEDQFFFLNYWDDTSLAEALGNPPNLHEAHFSMGPDQHLLKDEAYAPLLGDLIQHVIQREKIDLFVLTNPFQYGYNLIFQPEWFRGARVMSIFYDAIPYVMKDTYLKDKDARAWYLKHVDMLRWQDKILAISQCSKDDLVKLLSFPESQIEVIYAGVGEDFQVLSISEAEAQALYQRYQIRAPFLLGVLGDDFRKNMEGAIEAYAMLPRHLIDQYALVIICRLVPERYRYYQELLQKHGLAPDRVVFTNAVPQQDLLQLYNLAALLVYPSLYEGFGLPVVEAWASGTPVLTSDNSSLREIAEGAAVLVDASKPAAIRDGLARALERENLSDLTRQGAERLETFRWSAVAENAYQRFSQAVGNASDAATSPAPAPEVQRQRIAFFTPLPPMQSGISDYSVDLLPQLVKFFDIDVIIDTGYQAEAPLPPGARVLVHSEFQARDYQHVVYQFGNSKFHAYMIPYIQKVPGIMVLHDVNLHDLAAHLTLGAGDLKKYREYLALDYPPETVSEYLRVFQLGNPHDLFARFPINGFVTRYAQKIIVHSVHAQAKLLAMNIASDVRVVRQGIPITPPEDTTAAKVKMGFAPEDIVIAAFGHVHTFKRVTQIAYAFQRLSGEFPHAKLCFVGKPADGTGAEIERMAAQYGLQDRVRITGFVSMEAFSDYIDATDICMGLRYPENGETSGSLTRFLGKGRCVVINDVGSFGELPEGACVKLPSPHGLSTEEEIAMIQRALADLLQHPEKRRAIERRALAYARENLDVEIVAQRYAAEITAPARRSALTQLLLRGIAGHAQAHYTPQDMAKVARTLAFVKNPDAVSLG